MFRSLRYRYQRRTLQAADTFVGGGGGGAGGGDLGARGGSGGLRVPGARGRLHIRAVPARRGTEFGSAGGRSVLRRSVPCIDAVTGYRMHCVYDLVHKSADACCEYM
jgi:hypothetical protein